MKAIKYNGVKGSQPATFMFNGSGIKFKPGEVKLVDDVCANFLYGKYYHSPLGDKLFEFVEGKNIPLSVEIHNKSQKDKTIYVENTSEKDFCRTFDAMPFFLKAHDKKVISEKVFMFFKTSWRGDEFPLNRINVTSASEEASELKPIIGDINAESKPVVSAKIKGSR